MFPSAQVEIFGSFQTCLYLPTSDIDMVVLNVDLSNLKENPFYKLQSALIEHGVAEALSMKVDRFEFFDTSKIFRNFFFDFENSDFLIFKNMTEVKYIENSKVKKCRTEKKVIDRATVPIVKMRDMLTDIKVDISFNMKTGVESVSLIKEFIREFPALKPLVLLLKQFLLQR